MSANILSRKKWLSPLLVILILTVFILSPVYIMMADIYSYMEVGQTSYSDFSVGNNIVSYWVGEYTPPPLTSTEIANILLLVIIPCALVVLFAVTILRGTNWMIMILMAVGVTVCWFIAQAIIRLNS